MDVGLGEPATATQLTLEGGSALTDVKGNLRISGPAGAKVDLQGESGSVALEVTEAKASRASGTAGPR